MKISKDTETFFFHQNLTELRIKIEANKACPGYPGTNEDESCE